MTTTPQTRGRIVELLSVDPNLRSDKQVAQITRTLSVYPFFSKFSKINASKSIFRNLRIRHVNQGCYVFKYGDNPDCFYIVLSGSLNILVPKGVMSGSDWNLGTLTDDDFKKVTTIREGQSFGELALLANRPRAASIIADTNSILAVCDKKTYVEHVKEIEKYKLDKKLSFLKQNIWPKANNTLAMKSSYYFNEVKVGKNKQLFRENSRISHLYLIVKGKVSVI